MYCGSHVIDENISENVELFVYLFIYLRHTYKINKPAGYDIKTRTRVAM